MPLAVTPVVDPQTVWVVSMLVGLAWCVHSARRLELDPRPVYWAGIVGIALGIWGSHLLGLYVYGTTGELAWLRVWEGGKSWYGGFFGGALGALVVLRLARRPLLRYGDAMVPGVALGYAIGRVGCFLHGDDYGTPTSLPWAVTYGPGTEAHFAQARDGLIEAGAAHTVAIHPTQLYHSLVGLALFVALARVGPEPPGRRLALLAAGYGAARFALERVRGDFAPLALGLSLQQWISLLVVAIGAALALRARPLGSMAEAR